MTTILPPGAHLEILRRKVTDGPVLDPEDVDWSDRDLEFIQTEAPSIVSAAQPPADKP